MSAWLFISLECSGLLVNQGAILPAVLYLLNCKHLAGFPGVEQGFTASDTTHHLPPPNSFLGPPGTQGSTSLAHCWGGKLFH